MAVEESRDKIIQALLAQRNPQDSQNPLSFIWGPGGQRLTPEQIERQQKMAEKQMLAGGDYSPVQHWTQGAARVMGALSGVMRENRISRAAENNANASSANIAAMLAGLNQNQQGPSVIPSPQVNAPQANPSPFAAPPQADNSPFAAPPDLSNMPDIPTMTEVDKPQAVQPSITESAPPQMPPAATQPMATPQAPASPQQQSATPPNIMEISQDDLKRLRKLVLTEAVHGLGNDPYNQQVGGIVDTALNRVRSGLWGNDLKSVLNAKYQFSDINGPVSWKRGRTDVDQIPDSWLNTPNGKRAIEAVDAHLKSRETNPPMIGGHLNYANPYYSDASNLAWINKLDGPKLGQGSAIHWHGTAGNNKPVDANYFLKVAQQNPQAAAAMVQQNPQLAPLFLGDSHAAGLAQFGQGKNMGVNGAHIPAILQQLQNAPQNSRVFMSAGTNDAVGNWNEQTIRQQVQQAAEIAKARGLNLTWAGPTGPKGGTLDAILADATKQNGINYRSMQNQNFRMRDAYHPTIDQQGYGAMWNALNQQPQLQQQSAQPFKPFDVASLDPNSMLAPEGVPQLAPQMQQPQAEGEQLAQTQPFDINDMSFRAPSFAQQRQQAPQNIQQAPQQQQRPQIDPRIINSLTSPYASAGERAIAQSLIQQHLTASQPKYETKVLPNGDVVIVDERGGSVRPVYSAPKTQFGVIGKDQFGREQYGFINPNRNEVSPYAPPNTQQSQGPSQIPPVPAGVDPKIWNEQWSKRLTEGQLGPTDENVTKLRGEIRDLPSYKNMAVVGPAYNRMVKSAANDNRASDLSLVYTFMKMLDPGSVVRESEISMAQNVPTLPAQYRAQIESFLTGSGRLDPKVRQMLVGEAKIAAQSYRSAWDNDLRLYQGIIQRRKMNPQDVYSDFEPFQDFTPQPPTVTPSLNDIDAEIKRRGLR